MVSALRNSIVLTRESRLTGMVLAIFKTGNGERGIGESERGTGTGNGERGIFKTGNL